MKRLRLIATHVGWAGTVTLLSLLAAWSAIAFLLDSNVRLAIVFAVVAFLLDIADGFLARKLGTTSEFGRLLDSMVDAVNYSMLAALVAERVLLPGVLGFVVGFLILACGILRLVLFTMNGFEEEGNRLYYVGVITPHLTLAVALTYLVTRFVEVPDLVVAATLGAIALAQLSTIRTRKTGVLVFWIPASIATAIGALLWL
ncbi:MAG: CDP-alcohol phosphatidyltransferase family protein [Microbacteriaceae bacterium]|nr:CDP-alcohol phosphatidyltransferase family protein [Microbacteriaceae bacterium]